VALRHRAARLGDFVRRHHQLARLFLSAERHGDRGGRAAVHHTGRGFRGADGHRPHRRRGPHLRRGHGPVDRLMLRPLQKQARPPHPVSALQRHPARHRDRAGLHLPGQRPEPEKQHLPAGRGPAVLPLPHALLHAVQRSHPGARPDADRAREPLDLYLDHLLPRHRGVLPRAERREAL